MVLQVQPPPARARTRRLLAVTFVTLTLVAAAFLGMVRYFDRIHTVILDGVEDYTSAVVSSSNLRRSLVRLELNIRDLMESVLRSPAILNEERLRLTDDFRMIIEAAEKEGPHLRAARLLEELAGYRIELEMLLDDYSAIHAALADLYRDQELFKATLDQMEEDAGRLMVDMAITGEDAGGLQQFYFLLPLCQEHLLQSRVLIESSVASLDPALLGVGRVVEEVNEHGTALDSILNLERTLRTMTSADRLLSEQSMNLLEETPAYMDHIRKLYAALVILAGDREKFESKSDSVLSLLEEIDARTTEALASLREATRRHTRQGTLMGLAISAAVLGVSVLGLLLSGLMGRQLERTAEEATEAKARTEEVNLQLQEEIDQRRSVEISLEKARDGLELRVLERTSELSALNADLKKEIEERRQAEESLAGEKERLAVTLRSIGDGVITTDTDGQIIIINKIAEELTGWSQDEASGRYLHEVFRIVDGETRRPSPDPIERIVRSGKIIELAEDSVLISKDGRERKISDSGAPIMDRESNTVGVVLVFRDVTESARLEEELLKVKKLESVGVLAGGIAHDFNNILSAILGNINLALLYAGPDDEKVQSLLREAEKASLRARDLTHQLLTFSKGGEPVKEVASIAEVISDSADFVLRGSAAKCEYLFPEDLWSVEIDTSQMSQVVQNVILNASHAMPRGGLISIGGDNLVNDGNQALPLPPGDFVRVTVRDRGVGIPADMIDKVFDPYFTTKQKGSGLGLAITHSIVGKHGGLITIDSEQGAGSTVTIILPASREAQPASREESESAIMKGKGRVLVMDDEDMILTVAGNMLSHLGYEAVFAGDGMEAIELYRQGIETGNPVDIVIMDLTIPGGVGGKEAARKLMAIDPQAKVVVSSGYSNDPVMAHYRDYGFVAVINKPFKLKEFADLLHRTVPGSGVDG
jgi:PAS domain S-box-containing protein